MKLYYDTSVAVACCVEGHPHHAAASAAFERLARDKHTGVISAHGLAEVYSVLTRTPFTPPVFPNEAWRLVEHNLLPLLSLATLRADEYRRALEECADRGWAGGRVYDLLHLKCAAKEKCDRIFTFNVRHFRELAPKELADRICSP